jgi:hypothetical protein
MLAMMAYVLPTFPLGFFWHLTVFASYYRDLAVYREDMIIPFGIASMLIQGFVWAIVYEKIFAGKPVAQGAIGFASIAFPIAWTYMVLAVAAKHHMASVSGYLLIESAFVLVHYAVVSPLIAIVYAKPSRADS